MRRKVIFGCGKIGQEALTEYGQENVICFIDNYKTGSVQGINIISLDDFLKRGGCDDAELVVCTKYWREIVQQLELSKVKYTIYPPLIKGMPDFSVNIAHDRWADYLVEKFDFENINILEIGARKVISSVRSRFKNAQYTGLDIYPGENVDIVGDIHCLSKYFVPDRKFDLIFSSAVFEHLAMPWRAAEEIAKCLKVGGYVFIETHYCYNSHERPWHFFQFSEQALKVLFSKEMGFETIEAGVSNPIDGVFSKYACEYLRGKKINNLYCHSEFLGRKVREVEDFSWNKVDVNRLVEGTCYPEP